MKTPLPPAQRGGQALADWVVERLRIAIIEDYFLPGERLDQDLIASELGVSLTPVREGIRRLAYEGFIEVRPRYGAFIAEVSRDSIRKVYDVRCLLEAEVVRLVTPILPASALDHLDHLLCTARERTEAGDSAYHFAHDRDFHGLIMSYCENEILREMMDVIRNRSSVVRRFAQMQSGPHFRAGLAEHQAVLDAMRRRDPQEGAIQMRLHLERSAERLQSLMPEEKRVPVPA